MILLVFQYQHRFDAGRFAQAFRHGHPAMAELEKPQFKDWGAANKDRIGGMLSLMDDELGKHRFIAGEHYTIADITALVAIDFMRPIKYERPAELKNLARWYLEVSQRPSAKA